MRPATAFVRRENEWEAAKRRGDYRLRRVPLLMSRPGSLSGTLPGGGPMTTSDKYEKESNGPTAMARRVCLKYCGAAPSSGNPTSSSRNSPPPTISFPPQAEPIASRGDLLNPLALERFEQTLSRLKRDARAGSACRCRASLASKARTVTRYEGQSLLRPRGIQRGRD
jgi:hypothetical protein